MLGFNRNLLTMLFGLGARVLLEGISRVPTEIQLIVADLNKAIQILRVQLNS